jgi:hypothetical protein
MAFVAVLSWSRQIFLRFYLGAHMENFLRGHVDAFAAWGGVPRVALYDNLKSAVLERQGTSSVSTRPCWRWPVIIVSSLARWRSPEAMRRAVSSAPSVISATPSSPVAQFTDVDDLNAQADAWVIGTAGAALPGR